VNNVSVELLALHPGALPTLVAWYEGEWPLWYGSGRGDATRDLQAFSNQGCLPVGIVALRDGVVCGAAALKAESIESHKHLSPWAAAGFVDPALRGQGIGLRLLHALEAQARTLDFRRIYCGTSSAGNLLRRANWQQVERITHEGKELSIYEKAL